MTGIEWLSPVDISRAAGTRAPCALVADLREPALQPLLQLASSPQDLADFRRPGASERSYFASRRSLLKCFVATSLGCAGEDVVIAYDGPGAPRVHAPAVCEISVSGRGPFAALAVARSPVGIDIERLHEGVDVVDDVLHVNERADISRLRGEALRRRFLEIWTAKEAFLKAVGTGLNIDPARIAVEFSALAGGIVAVNVRHGEQTAWGSLRAHRADDDTLVCACVCLD